MLNNKRYTVWTVACFCLLIGCGFLLGNPDLGFANDQNVEIKADQVVISTQIRKGQSPQAQTLGTPTPENTPVATPSATTASPDVFIPDFQSERGESQDISTVTGSALAIKALSEWIGRFALDQGGVIWVATIITVLIAFNFKKLKSWRNLDVILLLIPAFLLVDSVRFATGLENPTKFTLFGIVFLAIFFVTSLLFIRAVIGGFVTVKSTWKPNPSTPALLVLLILLLLSNLLVTFVRLPDDAGFYTNVGAGRMLETGKFPYGDPQIKGGSAATYGPLLYVTHLPFQLILRGVEHDSGSSQNPISEWIVTGGLPDYDGPPILATKLTLLLFHFLGVAGLIIVGRQLAGIHVGLALACLYIGSAYVQGIGGETFFITGMTYISHIAPAAMTILAFAALGSPFLAGSLLGLGVGALFYPVFLFPLWLGYYFWRGQNWRDRAWIKFGISFAVVSLIIGAAVLTFSHTNEDESALQSFYESTVGHQEARDTYGASTFSFWGTHPRLAAFWQEPFITNLYLFRPSFLLFLIFIGASFFLARGRSIGQFAFLTAAVVISIQLWKSHAGGTYVEWYYPFLLIGMFAEAAVKAKDYRSHKPLEEKTEPD